ncbi:MAG: hypothetical protein Q9201_003777 [Fulgogasparrea decipioides]
MLSPSSSIVYPPSSSPPVALAGCKRPAQLEEQSEPKRRLVGRSLSISLRDPNHLDDAGSRENRSGPDPVTQTIPKVRIQRLFVDDEDNSKSDGSDSMAQIPSQENDPTEDQPLTFSIPKPDSLQPNIHATSTSGRRFQLKLKHAPVQITYERIVARRSSTRPGKATKSFYGIEIHKLIEKAAEPSSIPRSTVSAEDIVRPSVELSSSKKGNQKGRTFLWTEKYRAKKFTDLVGDERTHREVLRWVKHWDPIVFPGSGKAIMKSKSYENTTEGRPYRKILLLTGPPGLGKTTLVHVCARQAGYEVVEINASDERGRDVVKGRIRDMAGTENVRGVRTKTSGGTARRAGRPVCVVVDEVDGVVGSSGGAGEGGFIKALIDLVTLDQKNTETSGKGLNHSSLKQKKKGGQFRLLRPMILICNDVYHPALRPLRASGIADVIHVRKPPMDKVVSRLKSIFETEGIPCDSDGVRRLCEATWGVSNRSESRSSMPGTGEGDIRGLLVVGEWVAARLRAQDAACVTKSARLTRQWIQQHVLQELSFNGKATRSLGRGDTKETVGRIFQENGGFPKEPNPIPAVEHLPDDVLGRFGVSEAGKRIAIERLRDLVETNGECDRITTECFAAYASQPFQDDTLLSKPTAAYDWLHFHDSLSARVFSSQEWELSPYLSQSALGFHHLFASASKYAWTADSSGLDDDESEKIPFSGPRADYEAAETQKQNKTVLQAFQSSLSIPLLRSFRSPEDVVIGLLPHLTKILTPDVKPVIVGGSGGQKGIVSVRKKEEREMIERAVRVMSDVGITFERTRVEMVHGGGINYVYRMEPPVDAFTFFETATCGGPSPSTTRYAIRQALDQEYQKLLVGQKVAQARLDDGTVLPQGAHTSRNGRQSNILGKECGQATAPKRDFFGRIVKDQADDPGNVEGSRRNESSSGQASREKSGGNIFVSFHEGYSNAVRKPISLDELMRGL